MLRPYTNPSRPYINPWCPYTVAKQVSHPSQITRPLLAHRCGEQNGAARGDLSAHQRLSHRHQRSSANA